MADVRIYIMNFYDTIIMNDDFACKYHQRGGLVVSLRGRYRVRRWEIRVRISGRGNAR